MKKQLVPLIALLSISTAYANEINVQALQACTYVENDFNRLLCYDNTMAGKSLNRSNNEKKQTPSAKPVATTASTAAVSSQVTKAKNEDFGLEHKEAVKNNDDEITATVSSVKEAPYGELIITLDNAQQWRQIGSDRLSIKAGDKVTIVRGMFNSFLLKKEGQNRSIRVKRTN